MAVAGKGGVETLEELGIGNLDDVPGEIENALSCPMNFVVEFTERRIVIIILC